MAMNTGASAAASAVQPLTVIGMTTTKSVITSIAALRRPASPSRVSIRCSRCSANGAATSSAAMTPSRNAYP
jgi:hypothetical protein